MRQIYKPRYARRAFGPPRFARNNYILINILNRHTGYEEFCFMCDKTINLIMIWKILGSTKTTRNLMKKLKSKGKVFVGWNRRAERKEKREEWLRTLILKLSQLILWLRRLNKQEVQFFVTLSKNSLRRTSNEETNELRNLWPAVSRKSRQLFGPEKLIHVHNVCIKDSNLVGFESWAIKF